MSMREEILLRGLLFQVEGYLTMRGRREFIKPPPKSKQKGLTVYVDK